MLFAAVVTLSVLAVQGGELDSDTWDKIHKYNLLSFCYGEKWVDEFGKMQGELAYKCAGTPAAPEVNLPVTLPIQLTTANLVRNTVPAYAMPGFVYSPLVNHAATPLYGKKKREAAADQASQDEINNLLVGLGEYEKGMETKIGNLSCVLQGMGILDAAGNIIPEAISYEALEKELVNTKAGAEPGFTRKMADMFSDCLDIANSWPQTSLNRNDFMRKHGRHHIFFACMKKAEVKLCGQYQIYKYMEYFLGDLNLPGDKFDVGVAAYNVYTEQLSPEMSFIDDFFWGKASM